MVPFMLAGSRKGEQCVSVVSKDTEAEIARVLWDFGVDVKKCQPWGQFIFLDAADTYLKQGYFDPERMTRSFAELEKSALMHGFSGLRAMGEAAWFLSKLPGTQRLIEYEAAVNGFFQNSKTRALCLYDENRFGKDVLLEVLHTHPAVFIYGVLRDNPHYVPPERFFAQEREKDPDEAYVRTRDALLFAR